MTFLACVTDTVDWGPKMETNLSSWNTHELTSNRLELVPGHPLIQQGCRKCGRAFVDDCSTGERYAAHVLVFTLHRLSAQVTSRWLSEKCPGECLKTDEADRETRFLSGGLYRSAVHERANQGRDSGLAPIRKRN